MSEPIRILRIINRFNLGGPIFNVAYLTKYMDARFETKLIGGMKDDSEASSEFIVEQLGVEPEIVSEMKRSIAPSADYRAYKEIDRIIKEYRPHIVHTHASKSGTLGRLAAIRNKVPIVLHTFHGHIFHSYFSSLTTNIYKGIERYLARRSSRIIAISELQKHELGEIHDIVKKEKIEVVPLGFDLSRFQEAQEQKRAAFRKKWGLADDEIAISIVGRLVPIKHHQMFIDAAKELASKHPKARFMIVGGGESEADLKAYCQAKGIAFADQSAPDETHPLCFTSWIKDVDEVMAGSDIIALTSLNEGTPVSLIEAQAAAKPVVSARVGGIGDVVDEGNSGLLCDVRDTQTFASHPSKLIEDETLRTEMGIKGREHVLKKYSYHRLVKDMEHLYSPLLKEKGIHPTE